MQLQVHHSRQRPDPLNRSIAKTFFRFFLTGMDGNISLHKAHETATGIEHRLKEKYGEDTHVGIHVEPVK